MIGENIKRIRKEKHISQDRLSKLADITHTTLAKIEAGINSNPTIKTLKKIADTLDVSVDTLIKR